MKKLHKQQISLILIPATAMACNMLNPTLATPSSSALSPTSGAPTPYSTPAPLLPSGSGPCEAASSGGVTAYARPSTRADVFSASLQSPLLIGSRTGDGWLGFDPQKAQAANIGIFRMRWIPSDAPVTLSGNCAGVPVAEWVPEPQVCYEMVMGPVEVRAAADPHSAVTATLQPGDFAAIAGKSASGWILIDGDQANTPGVEGFIPEAETNANGHCDSIPTVP